MKWLKYKIKNWLREEVFKEELEDFRFMKLQCRNASAHIIGYAHDMDIFFITKRNTTYLVFGEKR